MKFSGEWMKRGLGVLLLAWAGLAAAEDGAPLLSLKGRNGLSLNYSAQPSLAWTRWTSETRAKRFGLGGNFSFTPHSNGTLVTNDYAGSLRLSWAWRYVLAPLGNLGHVFTQPGFDTQFGLLWARSEFPGAGNVTVYRDQVTYSTDLKLNWRMGAEVFWPGKRDLSLETSVGFLAGLKASAWYSEDVTNNDKYPPGPPIGGSEARLALATDVVRWDAALNFYY